MTTSFSIRIDKAMAPIAETLAGQDGSGRPDQRASRVFQTMAEAAVFAALIGFRSRRREPIESSRENSIPSGPFVHAQLHGYIFLIAVADRSDISILKDEQSAEAIKIFEEYVNGGFHEIDEFIEETQMPLFDAVLTMMDKAASQLKEAGNASKKKPIIIQKRRKIPKT